jgi:hypothetical protein
MSQGQSVAATLRTEVLKVFIVCSCIRILSARGHFQSPWVSSATHVSMAYLAKSFGVPLNNYPEYGSLTFSQRTTPHPQPSPEFSTFSVSYATNKNNKHK